MIPTDHLIDRWVYISIDRAGNDASVNETFVTSNGSTLVDAKRAISECVWHCACVKLVNFGQNIMTDASESIAVALWHECRDSGEEIDDSPYADFIRAHVPAGYDCGYRSNDRDDDDKQAETGHYAIRQAAE